MFNRIKVLRSGTGAKGIAQPKTSGRMADAGTGIGVVIAKHRPDHFLHQIGLFIGATAGRNAANRLLPILCLNATHLGCSKSNCFIPGYFLPGVRNRIADHWFDNAVRMRGIAIGETPLDTGMPPVRFAVFIRHHAHQFVTIQFGFERTAHAAIGASGNDRPLRRANCDHRFFLQGRGRAGRHASATGHTIRGQEGVGFQPRLDPAVKAAPLYRQSKRPLHLFAGPHAARTDDAFGGVIGEIGVAVVLGDKQRIRFAIMAHREVRLDRLITHIAQTHGPGHILQFAVAIGRTGQTIQRMVGNV